MDEKNIVTIFREANEKLPILNTVIELCYQNMPLIFQQVVQSKEFCALSQDLMIKILNNVVPMLPTAEQLAEQDLENQQWLIQENDNFNDSSSEED